VEQMSGCTMEETIGGGCIGGGWEEASPLFRPRRHSVLLALWMNVSGIDEGVTVCALDEERHQNIWKRTGEDWPGLVIGFFSGTLDTGHAQCKT
jgi:hypothetical protein